VGALVESVDSQVSKVRHAAAAMCIKPTRCFATSMGIYAHTSHCLPMQAFQQEKELSREAKEARNLAHRFRDVTAGWVSAAQRADKVLRDYGDYETFLQTIVDDMTEVDTMLHELHQLRAAKAAEQL
jgi:hypothetical protein